MISKTELRAKILNRRDRLSQNERRIKSDQIAAKITAHNAFLKADKILLFATFKSEVDTKKVFEAAQKLSKDIYYPRVKGKEMEFYLVQKLEELIEGYRGILEPKEDLDKRFKLNTDEKMLVLMPGAVFDEDRNRIGYGGGYYDKYLQPLDEFVPAERICKIALAFECQIVERGQIPKEKHDVHPDFIVTENRIIS